MAPDRRARDPPRRKGPKNQPRNAKKEEIDARPVCRDFMQNKCHRGAKCNYSHDTSRILSSPAGLDGSRKPPTQRQDRNHYEWKRYLRSPPDGNKHYEIRQLWKSALSVLDGHDQDAKQKLAQDLVSLSLQGYQHIIYLMQLDLTSLNNTLRAALKDFLLVVTHEDVLHSLAIDVFVGELYISIRGSNGERLLQFLSNLCESLEASADWNQQDSVTIVSSMSKLLRWMLRKEIRVRFHEDLLDSLDLLETAVNRCLTEPGRVRDTTLQYILEMKSMSMSAHLPPTNIIPTAKQRTMPAYPTEIWPPGDRHDNDHANIQDIVIFPTTSEIKSDHPDYLPFADRDRPHHLTDPAARHIDTQFRLLRHDTFKELKDVLGRLYFAKARNEITTHLDLGDMRAHQYRHAVIESIDFKAREGLQFQISFQLPDMAILQGRSTAEKTTWWQESKRLSEGILACLVVTTDSEIDYLFFVIVEKEIKRKEDNGKRRKNPQVTIVSKLASLCEADMYQAAMWSCKKIRGTFIEFPGIIPATFRPILENLQMMQRDNRLPFREWLLPEPVVGTGRIMNIPPPLYARRAGFAFSLEPILLPGQAAIDIQPGSHDHAASTHAVQLGSGLDKGQAKALIAALSNEFAFIQGPPGTGKSYLGVQLMKVLLHHKETAELGPVVVVCYTNHALDQFLEHLLQDGIKRVVRIGRRSQSDLLASHNLADRRQVELKTRSEGQLAAKAYGSLDESEASIKRRLGELHDVFNKKNSCRLVRQYVERHHAEIARQFNNVDEEDFQTVGKHPFDQWMGVGLHSMNTSSRPIDTLLLQANASAATLLAEERKALITFWLQEMQANCLSLVFEDVEDSAKTRRNLDHIHDEASRRVLKDCDVIGVTTTGLAKSISLLQHVQAKVIICEEAGEVMEPHMICALLPAVEHFIQIGDHQQLRPQINSYSLQMESAEGKSYQLDRSQFERLSVGEPNRPKMPLVQLDQQRRMRPEISSLIRQTLYPRLQDHPSTLDKDDIVGLRSNLFWLNHTYPEDDSESGAHDKSHSNDYEVGLVQALVRHVIRQGVYASNDIAVLTPYAGQLSKLRTALSNDFEIVLSERDQDVLEDEFQSKPNLVAKKKLLDLLRIATVDNFQGEEAKVVIVSLVRSNVKNRVGFLRTTNRINVLLSRAQNGMYLIGNAATYSQIEMWQQVIDLLQADDNIGFSIGLCCPRHRNTLLEVSTGEDFARLSPEGGCQVACGRRLDCGHTCHSRCHADSMHRVVNCSEPCQRLHKPCEHVCQQATCGEPCGKCKAIIKDVKLPCGHRQDVYCYLMQDVIAIQCTTLVQRIVPGCLHAVSLECAVDVEAEGFECPYDCLEFLPCGHQCPGTCSQCKIDSGEGLVYHHLDCRTICKKPHGTCEHLCQQSCHLDKPCGPCRQPCEVRCQHSQCQKLCFEPCAPCIEPCAWSCEHQGQCSMPCGAPCDRLPCNERCIRILSCGHQCPGVCGEDCLDAFCQECGHNADARVDLILLREYAEIDVNTEPVIALSCGHFFVFASLDGMVGMNDFYTINREGQFDGLQNISTQLAFEPPRCPDCKCPVRQHVAYRYGRIVNRAIIDVMTKRFIIAGHAELSLLSSEVDGLADNLEDTKALVKRHLAPPSASNWRHRKIKARLQKANAIYDEVEHFVARFTTQNQPAQKIHQAIIHATRRREGSLAAAMAVLHLEPKLTSDPTRSVVLGAELLQHKTRLIKLQEQLLITGLTELQQQALEISLPSRSSIMESISSYIPRYQDSIDHCLEAKLPKLGVQGILGFVDLVLIYRASAAFEAYKDEKDAAIAVAKQLLDEASALCHTGFKDAETVESAVELMIQRIYGDTRYQEVSEAEKAMIKAAMLSGRDSLASHSGHWYNCVNGHPFAIGECGMPMQLARCPECNAPIGGQRHVHLAGVSRAHEME